jgi:hypothetical protein
MEPLTAGDPRQVGVYRLQSRLGAGGMGRVYLGSSPGGRAVAVKIVHPELARDPEFMRRFRREAEAAEAVSGAYTAPVVGAGPDDDPPWLATAYVAGPSLAELVARSGPLPEAAVWRLAGGLIEALQAIHVRGLVHRDLKPGNILIAADGPRVIDFGISRALHGTALTSTRTAMGTPAYMSPEQAEGGEVGPPSDVFSLGSVLAFAATGLTPFGGGEPLAVIYRIVGGQPDLGRLPPALGALVARCLAKDPASRPALSTLMNDVTVGLGSFPAAAPGKFWPEPVADMAASAAGPFPATAQGRGAPSEAGGAPAAHPATVLAAWPARPTPPPSLPPGPGPGPRRRAFSRWPLVGAAVLVAAAAGAGLALKLAPGSPAAPGAPAASAGGNRLAAKTSAPRAARSRPASAPASSPAASSPAARPASSPSTTLTATVCIFPADGCTGPDESQYMKPHPSLITDSGDGSGYVKNLVWSNWGEQEATATGVEEIDDCNPNCAQGSFAGYAATVTVAGLKPYGTGLEGYSTIVIEASEADNTSTFTTDTVP